MSQHYQKVILPQKERLGSEEARIRIEQQERLSHSLATEQIKNQVKRGLQMQHNALLWDQLQQDKWQKSFNFQHEREVDLSSNMLTSLQKRQYDYNAQNLNRMRQEAYKDVLDRQVLMKQEDARLL